MLRNLRTDRAPVKLQPQTYARPLIADGRLHRFCIREVVRILIVIEELRKNRSKVVKVDPGGPPPCPAPRAEAIKAGSGGRRR